MVLFFSEEIIKCLNELGMEYSISVPFERYATTIKCYIEERKRSRRLRAGAKYFAGLDTRPRLDTT